MRHPGVAACMAGIGACLCAGCIAVDVGEPEIFRNTETARTTDTTPVQTVVADARVQLLQKGGQAEVVIQADIEDRYKWRSVETTTVVKKQKKLAFGLFPGAAEIVWMPDDALTSAMTVRVDGSTEHPRYISYYENAEPSLGRYAGEQVFNLVVTLGILTTMNTLNSLFVSPFGDWECSNHDYVDMDCYRLGVEYRDGPRADASESPKLQRLAQFPADVRSQIGVSTCFDGASRGTVQPKSHFGLLGVHKYLSVSVGEEENKRKTESGLDPRRRKAEIPGPYEAELSIPGLGYSERKAVPPGEARVLFALPGVLHDGLFGAYVSIRECPGGGMGDAPDLTRQSIRKLTGQASRFELVLRGRERLGPEGNCEILGILPSQDGRYSVRVRIRGNSGKEDAVSRIEEDVRRLIREDYANRHPGARADEIRECVVFSPDAGDDGVLEFTGWAFSAHPLSDGWHYDAETRLGEVRVLLSEGLPADRALQWARENVAAIVADKASALTVGVEALPESRFRCLWERFENGILTIGFEKEE